MNLLKIALSNIRKRKTGMITLSVMLIIASLMLIVSLNLIIGSSDFFDKKVKELNAANLTLYAAEDFYNGESGDEIEIFIRNLGGYKTIENENCFRSFDLNAELKSRSFSGIGNFLSMESDRELSPLKVIDKARDTNAGDVILPLTFKTDGFKTGDNVKLMIGGKEYVFKIYGFAEDAEFGSAQTTLKNFYIREEKLSSFESDANFQKIRRISVLLNNPDEADSYSRKISSAFPGSSFELITVTKSLSEMGALTTISVVSVFVLMVAVLVLIISLIVVRFNILNSVEDDAKNYGALKSAGYTYGQISAIILLQYLLISVAAIILGAALSLLAAPFVGDIVASQSGLLWHRGFDFVSVLISAAVILIIIIATAYLCARKIKNITPVNALRAGHNIKNIKRSPLKLDNKTLPLNIHLGLKEALLNIKNNITVFLVLFLFVFISLTGLMLQYNFTEDKTALIEMIGIDLCMQYTFLDDDFDWRIAEIEKDGRVERISYGDQRSIYYNDVEGSVEMYRDYSEKMFHMIYKGRYPTEKNECAIGSAIAKNTKKVIGDEIELEYNGKKEFFTIVGFTQSLSSAGNIVSVTEEGLQRFDGDYVINNILVYFHDINDIDVFEREFREILGENVYGLNANKIINDLCDSMAVTFDMVYKLILVSSVAVIILVLFLLISSLIRKNKTKFGILKAAGYTNFNLTVQLLFSFMPVIIIGAALGLMFGFIFINPITALIMSSLGTVSASYTIPLGSSILLTLALAAVSMATIIILALKIRGITAYKLIME